jgi:hypothetical protein
MKFFFRISRIGFLSLAIIALTSCQFISVNFVPFSNYITPIDAGLQIEEDNYYRPSSYLDSFTDMVASNPIETRRTVTMPTTGNQKVLVIPVDFPDYRCTALKEGCLDSITILQNAFFGQSRMTQWESVASYYHKSSYGQLTIEGKVSDWFTYNQTTNQLKQSSSKVQTTSSILTSALNWYRTNYDDLDDFDLNNDGYVDGVFLVYASPFVDFDSIFWGFTSFATGNQGSQHIGNPIANGYVWASYHFMNVFGNKADSHTYIHEMGHLLGLKDYYNESSIPSTFPIFASDDHPFKRYQYSHSPTGRVDMMDYSLGDHTVLSKMLLNWSRPYVVTGSGSITIRPFSQYGDAIIIANNWNGNAFDEYIALEFYSPTGLNYLDSAQAYGHAQAQLMSNYGLKVYHVDARAGWFATSNNSFINYENDLLANPDLIPTYHAENPNTYYRALAHANTYERTVNENMLYRLLEKGGETTLLLGAMATNDTLFYQGDSFGINDFSSFTFNDGSSLPFAFIVESLNRYQMTVTFSNT